MRSSPSWLSITGCWLSSFVVGLGGTGRSLCADCLRRAAPGGFPSAMVDTGKVRIYSWLEIVTWLREALGEDVPKPDHELVLADHALRLADEAQRGGKADVDAVRHLVGCC